MALGFGFNRQKVLATAERFVQQGKLNNAIAEYEKIIAKEPKDLTVLNTVGDLYARLGRNERANDYFRRVAENYFADGFTVKAIAMYKKMAKLDASSLGIVQKLADLFSQQGLINEARQQYVVLADAFMKKREYDGAVRIFGKLLEMDPQNSSLQSKMADLYIRLGKKDEAGELLFRIANSLYEAGSKEAAEKTLARLLEIDPSRSDALMLRGKIAVELGRGATAVKALESIADIDSRPEGLHQLLKARLLAGKFQDAEPLARKLASVHNDFSGVLALAEGLGKGGQAERALSLYEEFSDRLLAGDNAEAVSALQRLISRVKESAAALERLRTLLIKAGSTTHISEVNELLAHAWVQAGELVKARDLYKELAELEPTNQEHMQNYHQVMARLGEEPTARPLEPEEREQAVFVGELEAPAGSISQQYPAELSEAIQSALTDAELYESYNKAQNAIPVLEEVLKRAPNDVRLNHKLAEVYAKVGRLQDAAGRCLRLQEVYKRAGKPEEARQFAEMAQHYAGGKMVEMPEVAPPEMPATSAPPRAPTRAAAPPVAPSTAAQGADAAAFDMEITEEQAAAPAGEAHEIDLSEEWEAALREEPQTATEIGAEAARLHPSAVSDLLEEIRFYLAQSMLEDARLALTRLESLAPETADLVGLKRQLQKAAATFLPPTAAPPAPRPASGIAAEMEPQEIGIDEIIIEEPEPAEFQVVAPTAPPPTAPAVQPPATIPSPTPTRTVPPATAVPTAPHAPFSPAPVARLIVHPTHPAVSAAPVAHGGDVLNELVLDLEQSLGDDFASGIAAAHTARSGASPAARTSSPVILQPETVGVGSSAGLAAPPARGADILLSAEDSALLADVFAEFKEEVEETSTSEDLETHYGLGVAFKEMGLLDEAIGELQKVCLAIDHGEPFSQSIQAYTWLAHCFTERGVPEAGIKWYEKALKMPGDAHSRTAIHYELGSACEAAGMRDAALKHFLEVYGSNIDYRDVAERIKALKS